MTKGGNLLFSVTEDLSGYLYSRHKQNAVMRRVSRVKVVVDSCMINVGSGYAIGNCTNGEHMKYISCISIPPPHTYSKALNVMGRNMIYMFIGKTSLEPLEGSIYKPGELWIITHTKYCLRLQWVCNGSAWKSGIVWMFAHVRPLQFHSFMHCDN